MKHLTLATCVALLALGGAYAPITRAAHGPQHADAQADAALTDGEVRRINKEQNKITLRHGEIKSLEMPAMTMVFNVRDPALLDKVQVGDKVRFVAEKAPDGAFFVTAIEKP